jgi:hypothetical protein
MSTYLGFSALLNNGNGTYTPVPSIAVQVKHIHFDALTGEETSFTTLDDVEADASGHVPTGTLPGVAAGELLRFTYVASNGRCGYAERLTT